MALILHLVRHPPPEVAPGICYGRLDVPAREVAAAARRLQPLLPAGVPVWSSPLRRCRELADGLGAPVRVDPRLAEIHFGDWEGRPWEAIGPAALNLWAADLAGFAPPGGESPLAVQARALEFVAGLGEGEAVAVTHAGVMRVLVAHWQRLPPGEWLGLGFGFGTVTTVEIDDTGATIRRMNS